MGSKSHPSDNEKPDLPPSRQEWIPCKTSEVHENVPLSDQPATWKKEQVLKVLQVRHRIPGRCDLLPKLGICVLLPLSVLTPTTQTHSLTHSYLYFFSLGSFFFFFLSFPFSLFNLHSSLSPPTPPPLSSLPITCSTN